ncbi:MAG: hypothetical protein FJW69_06280 [Actinobacteria bacterium]|nr:hypothetical protein [Actinomycetota bacterium]
MKRVNFDNIEYSSFRQICLTTFDQPKYEMGKIAAEIAYRQVKEQEKRLPPEQIVLETNMIIKNSCKKISKFKNKKNILIYN